MVFVVSLNFLKLSKGLLLGVMLIYVSPPGSLKAQLGLTACPLPSCCQQQRGPTTADQASFQNIAKLGADVGLGIPLSVSASQPWLRPCLIIKACDPRRLAPWISVLACGRGRACASWLPCHGITFLGTERVQLINGSCSVSLDTTTVRAIGY